jgi:DNA-binding response OmpR family regulator
VKRILIIDDEPTIRFLLKEVITDWGYEFIEASRAQRGIEIIKSETVDLVLLDIQLPQMNGLEAIQKIREIDRNLPVFMLTAFHNLKDVVNMLNVSVQQFITKPFDIDDLHDKIRKELGE